MVIITMSEKNDTIEKTDIVKSFMGGTIKYRVPHIYEINDKKIEVGYAFIVQCDGKNHNLPLDAVKAIVAVYRNDPDFHALVENLPKRDAIPSEETN